MLPITKEFRRRPIDRRTLSEVQQEFQVSIGVYASENGAVQSVQRGLLPL